MCLEWIYGIYLANLWFEHYFLFVMVSCGPCLLRNISSERGSGEVLCSITTQQHPAPTTTSPPVIGQHDNVVNRTFVMLWFCNQWVSFSLPLTPQQFLRLYKQHHMAFKAKHMVSVMFRTSLSI